MTRRKILVMVSIAFILTFLLILYTYTAYILDTPEDAFKQLVYSIYHHTSGATLINITISYRDMYNTSNAYRLVIIEDNNYCQPYLESQLWYHGQLVAEYYRSNNVEAMKIYNRTALVNFINTFLKGYEEPW